MVIYRCKHFKILPRSSIWFLNIKKWVV